MYHHTVLWRITEIDVPKKFERNKWSTSSFDIARAAFGLFSLPSLISSLLLEPSTFLDWIRLDPSLKSAFEPRSNNTLCKELRILVRASGSYNLPFFVFWHQWRIGWGNFLFWVLFQEPFYRSIFSKFILKNVVKIFKSDVSFWSLQYFLICYSDIIVGVVLNSTPKLKFAILLTDTDTRTRFVLILFC